MNINQPLQNKERIAQQLAMIPIPLDPRAMDQIRNSRLDGFLNQLFGRQRNSTLDIVQDGPVA